MKIIGIVLSGGYGKINDRLKVFADLCGKPMVCRVVDALRPAVQNVIVVANLDSRQKMLRVMPDSVIVTAQPERCGTAGATLYGLPSALALGATHVLITYADMPLISKSTYQYFTQAMRQANEQAITIATVKSDQEYDSPFESYGRVKRNRHGSVCSVVDIGDLALADRKIREFNVGIYGIKIETIYQQFPFLRRYGKCDGGPSEVHLIDMVRAFEDICAVELKNLNEALGVNNREELERAIELIAEADCNNKTSQPALS